jgi:hypothetical protein
VLQRDPSDPADVTVTSTVETGSHGSLDGTENDPARWPQRVVTTWRGRYVADRMTLTTLDPRTGEERAMTLTCKDAVVNALAARALPVQLTTRTDQGPTHRWEPRETEDVEVLQCAKPGAASEAATTLSFARSPGVEWAFESFDWSDPQAAFRRIAPRP